MMRTACAVAVLLASYLPLHAEVRFPDIPIGDMSPEQKAIWDSLTHSARPNVRGPFQAWLRSPELAERLIKLGEYVRFKSTLPPNLSEFAILMAGRFWNSAVEWDIHYPLAIKAGVTPAVLADLSQGKRPLGMNEKEALIYDFTSELRRQKRVSDVTYDKMLTTFGERGILDIITIAGHYDSVCMTLNVAQVPVPAESSVPRLAELQ